MAIDSYVVRRLVALVALTTLAAACGGSGSKNSSTPAAAVTIAATHAAAGSTVPPRTEVDRLNITAKEFSFTFNVTSIHKGPPGVDVFFQNDGSVAHTVSFYLDNNFNKPLEGASSDNVAAGASVGFSFIPPINATSLYYRCDLHPTQMNGELTVE